MRLSLAWSEVATTAYPPTDGSNADSDGGIDDELTLSKCKDSRVREV